MISTVDENVLIVKMKKGDDTIIKMKKGDDTIIKAWATNMISTVNENVLIVKMKKGDDTIKLTMIFQKGHNCPIQQN